MNWHATRLLAYENQIMPEHRVVRPKLDLLDAMIGSCFDFADVREKPTPAT